jgi:hypothetical protein
VLRLLNNDTGYSISEKPFWLRAFVDDHKTYFADKLVKAGFLQMFKQAAFCLDSIAERWQESETRRRKS